MFKTSQKNKRFKLLTLVLIALVMIVGCSKKEVKMNPGEYTVDVTGMQPMKVAVTLSETEITDIKILEQNETKGIADEALTSFPKQIVESQDLTIDAVSNATKTSNAIIEGVKLAIQKAGGNPEAFGEVTGTIKFEPGTYEGVAEGHNGQVKAAVEFSGDKILSVKIIESDETEHLSDVVYEQLPKAIIEEQSLNVDTVTGATVTSMAVKKAIGEAVKEAGGNPELLNKVSPKELSTEVKELTTDVVVVGGGSAGISAALTSEQAGHKVILIEKNAMYGGHTALSGGWTLITGSKIQKDLGVTNDTPELAFDDVMANGGNNSDPELLQLFVDNMGAAADWTVDYVGAEIPDSLKVLPENQVDRALVYTGGGKGISDALVAKMNETEIQQYLNTKAEELIIENGEIVGVVAKAKDGTTYKIKADSVVLATGGHGARRDLLGESLDSFVYYGAALASGDGLDLGQSVGGDIIDMSFVELFENGVEWKPGIAKSTFNGSMAAWEAGGILVDRNGNRVVNEKGMGPDIVAQQAKQEDARLFIFMDQATFTKFRENIGGYGISEQMLDGWLENNGKVKPYFAHGQTVDETTGILNINAENLKATMERYNTFVENGLDEDFGRDPKYMTQGIGDGPYYLVEQLPRYATTLGGLTVNTDLQVLNGDGQVIKGLYAIGDTAAGVRGDNSISGSDIGWAITSGYLIGDILGK